jgi:very-short-patch-repair endonuclease
VLTQLVRRYATIPYQRTRSDAEALGLELLHDAGFEPPRVNFTIAGEEADLCWPARRLIVEIDGPQFHRFPDEDACKQRAWEADGYVVRRLPSDAVYHRPDALLGILAAQ